MEKQGYEICAKGYYFCVDNNNKIRGWYASGCRHYLSNWELWSNKKGIRILKGEIKIGEKISLYDNKGNILELNNRKMKDLEIKILLSVDINKMTENPYIAGVDKPIIKPNSFN